MKAQNSGGPIDNATINPAGERLKVLIVDDEEDFLLLMRLTLEDTGRYAVTGESDPRRVLDAARDQRPDVILLDVMMPEMDGGDIAAALRNDPLTHPIPIIFVTAIVGSGETPPGIPLQSGGEFFLPKPVDFAELEECIRQLTQVQRV